MTESNQIGYVAAYPIPEVIRGINAFTLGVRKANPEATVKVVWTNTWFDPQKERQAAEALLDAGADVIAQHQDTTGPQLAAQDAGRLRRRLRRRHGTPGAGGRADQPDLELGRLLHRPSEQVMAGTWDTNQYWGGWQDGVVGLAPIGAMVPDDVAAAMAES